MSKDSVNNKKCFMSLAINLSIIVLLFLLASLLSKYLLIILFLYLSTIILSYVLYVNGVVLTELLGEKFTVLSAILCKLTFNFAESFSTVCDYLD